MIEEVKLLSVGSRFHSQIRYQTIYDSEWACYYYQDGWFVHQDCCEIQAYRAAEVISWDALRTNRIHVADVGEDSSQSVERIEPNSAKEPSGLAAHQVLDKMPKTSVHDELILLGEPAKLNEELVDDIDGEATPMGLVERLDDVKALEEVCFDPGGTGLSHGNLTVILPHGSLHSEANEEEEESIQIASEKAAAQEISYSVANHLFHKISDSIDCHDYQLLCTSNSLKWCCSGMNLSFVLKLINMHLLVTTDISCFGRDELMQFVGFNPCYQLLFDPGGELIFVRKAVDLALKLSSNLCGLDNGLDNSASLDMIGGSMDLNVEEVQFFLSKNGTVKHLKAVSSIVYEQEPEKYIWEGGCLLSCQLPVKLLVYVSASNTSDAQAMHISAHEALVAKFKDPQLIFMVESAKSVVEEVPDPVIIRGVELDSLTEVSNLRLCDANMLCCSYFLADNKPLSSICAENAGIIRLTVLLNKSDRSSELNSPITEYFPASEATRLWVVDYKLEVVCYAVKDLPLNYAISKLIILALADQLNAMKSAILPSFLEKQPELRPYHFTPPSILHPITVIYELTYGEQETKQVELRKSLHIRFGLPTDRPVCFDPGGKEIVLASNYLLLYVSINAILLVHTKYSEELLLTCESNSTGNTLGKVIDPPNSKKIAWHIYEMLHQQDALHKDLNVARVVFQEITQSAIKAALQSPRDIDENLVHAYLARRALDYVLFKFEMTTCLLLYILIKDELLGELHNRNH